MPIYCTKEGCVRSPRYNLKGETNCLYCSKHKEINMINIKDKMCFEDGCSKKRPDLLGDMGTHVVIIEIDENKHDRYSCENKRIMELSQDVDHRSIIFIRFNPDGYIDGDGNKVKSCWTTNKLGITVIVKNKMKEWEERIESLMKQIIFWKDNAPKKMIETIELYY
jgi:hypothetical protein